MVRDKIEKTYRLLTRAILYRIIPDKSCTASLCTFYSEIYKKITLFKTQKMLKLCEKNNSANGSKWIWNPNTKMQTRLFHQVLCTGHMRIQLLQLKVYAKWRPKHTTSYIPYDGLSVNVIMLNRRIFKRENITKPFKYPICQL